MFMMPTEIGLNHTTTTTKLFLQMKMLKFPEKPKLMNKLETSMNKLIHKFKHKSKT